MGSVIVFTLVSMTACSAEPPQPTDPSTGPAAEGLTAICESASSEEGTIVWYESSLPEQADDVIAAFTGQFPHLSVEHVRSSGGQAIPAMIIQESQANARTADVATGTYDQGKLLEDRGLLSHMTAAELGISDEALLPVPYGIVTADTFTAAIYNTDLVAPQDVPESWDDFADDKWKNKMGIFQRGGQFFADWVDVWGEEKADAFIEKIAALKPVLAESTFTLAEDIGAGVRPIGIGLYHTGAQVQETGAPIEVNVLEPVAMMPIASYVLEGSPNPLSARCFAGWLVTKGGALAYENATMRGNHLIEGTKTHKILQGKELAGWSFDDIEKFAELTGKYNEILSK